MNAQLKTPNVPRAHPRGTYGARAILAAREWRVGRESGAEISPRYDVTKATLSFAGIVLDFAPELAEAVISGKMGLRTAYTRAREWRRGYAVRRGDAEPLSLGERRAVWLLHALATRAP
jgi:hypothetical protein